MKQTQNSRRRCASKELRGSIQIEAMIALSVLVIAVLGFSRTATAGMQQQRAAAERGLAMAAARQVIEDMGGLPLEELWARYNADTADDPPSGVSPGPNFDIERLQAALGDVDGMAGQIMFPEAATSTKVPGLREDIAVPRFGLPYDLDGDGDIGPEDVSETLRLLPVAVEVRWRSAKSVQRIELRTWLGSSVTP